MHRRKQAHPRRRSPTRCPDPQPEPTAWPMSTWSPSAAAPQRYTCIHCDVLLPKGTMDRSIPCHLCAIRALEPIQWPAPQAIAQAHKKYRSTMSTEATDKEMRWGGLVDRCNASRPGFCGWVCRAKMALRIRRALKFSEETSHDWLRLEMVWTKAQCEDIQLDDSTKCCFCAEPAKQHLAPNQSWRYYTRQMIHLIDLLIMLDLLQL